MTQSPSLQETMAQLRAEVNDALNQVMEALDGADGDAPQLLVEAMRYAVLGGGKRMRPVLALSACEAVGGQRANAVPVACALELVHAYSLVHDDLPCMDNDLERRGQPTVHVRYGQARAVLTGDALLTEAFRVLARPSWTIDAQSRIEAIALVADAAGAAGMVGGQEHDMAAEGKVLSVEALTTLHAMKTGALFRAAVVGGGICAGADADVIARLDRYGRCVGKAFQLTDDLLDLREVAADATETGDPHEDAVNLAVRMGPEVCQSKASALVAEAVAIADGFGDAGQTLAAIARMIEHRTT